jgi:predicted neutral ceramidase superfamily lipid hydrolase
VSKSLARLRTKLSSLGFQLQRTARRIATAKPSVFVMTSTLVALTVFFLGGGVYDLLAQPLIAFPMGRRILFFYPYSVHEQAVVESLLVMTSYVLGFFGVFLMYQSTKYAYKPRQAYILLLTGIIFLLIAYIYIENLLWAKLTVSP